MAMLEAHGVVVEYRRRGQPPVRAVVGVDLTVERGQIVGLVGESGCGKSTLARAVVGLLPRAEGTVTLDGRTVAPLTRSARPVEDRAIQMIFQNPYASLNPRRRIWRQVADGIAKGQDVKSKAVSLLGSVGIPEAAADRYPHEFSGGQQQRIAIARALAPDPALIVADEAVSALDASTQAQVANLLVDLARSMDVGLLFISHDLSVVRHIADAIAVMYLGTVVEAGPTEEIWNDPLHPYTRALVGAVPQMGPNATAPTGLPGDVPDPANPPPGCRFHPRCPEVLDRCRRAEPVWGEVEQGRFTECWLHTGEQSIEISSAGDVA